MMYFHRSRRACRIRQTGLYRLAEDFILYTVEPYVVKYTVKYQICSVDADVGYVRQKLLRIHQLLFASFSLFTEQVKAWMASLPPTVNPSLTFINQLFNNGSIRRHTNGLQFRISA